MAIISADNLYKLFITSSKKCNLTTPKLLSLLKKPNCSRTAIFKYNHHFSPSEFCTIHNLKARKHISRDTLSGDRHLPCWKHWATFLKQGMVLTLVAVVITVLLCVFVSLPFIDTFWKYRFLFCYVCYRIVALESPFASWAVCWQQHLPPHFFHVHPP